MFTRQQTIIFVTFGKLFVQFSKFYGTPTSKIYDNE